MKKLSLSFILALAFCGCKKESAPAPGNAQPVALAPVPQTTSTSRPAVSADTLADMSHLMVSVVLDSINNDETMLVFKKNATPLYNTDQDAKYMQGFGAESLASLTADNAQCAVNVLPYVPGRAIGLYVNAENSGNYTFKISREQGIPAGMHVWLRDNSTRDSLDLRYGNYQFAIKKADTTSFGSKRFQLVLRASN